MPTKYEKSFIMNEGGMITSAFRSQRRESQFVPVIIIIGDAHPLDVMIALKVERLEGLIIFHTVLMIHLHGTLGLFSYIQWHV